MKENLPPGPKRRRKRAVDGTLCPPGSEGHRVWRGKRWWRPVCKKAGHPKPHPGRCVECRRASDKRRRENPKRREAQRESYQKWLQKADSREKIAAWAKRRNQRPEQKAKRAEWKRDQRHKAVLAEIQAAKTNPKPNPVAERLNALATAKANQAKYGIERIAYL